MHSITNSWCKYHCLVGINVVEDEELLCKKISWVCCLEAAHWFPLQSFLQPRVTFQFPQTLGVQCQFCFTNTWDCHFLQGGTWCFSQLADPASEVWDSIRWCSSSAELDQHCTGRVLPGLRERAWCHRSPASRLSCINHPCDSCPWHWTGVGSLVRNTLDVPGAQGQPDRFGAWGFCQADNLGRVMPSNSRAGPSVMVPVEPSSLKVWFWLLLYKFRYARWILLNWLHDSEAFFGPGSYHFYSFLHTPYVQRWS